MLNALHLIVIMIDDNPIAIRVNRKLPMSATLSKEKIDQLSRSVGSPQDASLVVTT
ncbi:MAG: hypothetical protein GY821_12320 [Gammaproteobacteria bacterium]|nr:hypothetical protein [Gammaproteobacteria bacterium]